VSAHSASLNFQSVRPRIHNPRGIFADADATARRKVPGRAVLRGGGCLRDDVAGIDLRTRCPRSTLQGRLAPAWVVSAHSQSLNFQSCHNNQSTIFAASLQTPTPFHAVKFGDAPRYYAVIGRVTTLQATDMRSRRPRSAVQGRLAPAAGGVAQVKCFRATPLFAVRRRRRHRLCRRQAPLHGASRATRPQISCPQGHHATNHRVIAWRVTELYGVKRRRHQQRCREDCVFWGL
jgi:hypothetical protein